MKVDPEYGRGAIRWSLGRSTTKEQIDQVVARLEQELGDRTDDDPDRSSPRS
jgi:cysteine sulfinate desulfinase/cysteine desulfurase-like protein